MASFVAFEAFPSRNPDSVAFGTIYCPMPVFLTKVALILRTGAVRLFAVSVGRVIAGTLGKLYRNLLAFD